MAHRENFTDDYEFEVTKTEAGGYSIVLPHQCDNWEILGAEDEDFKEKDGGSCLINFPTNKEFAVKQMELFIKRANEALERLRSLV